MAYLAGSPEPRSRWQVYTWKTPNGRKISIALEELGVEYQVHPIDTGADEQFSDAFLAINANHKIPAIGDDGQAIWESGAILLHLSEKHDGDGRTLPKDRSHPVHCRVKDHRYARA